MNDFWIPEFKWQLLDFFKSQGISNLSHLTKRQLYGKYFEWMKGRRENYKNRNRCSY